MDTQNPNPESVIRHSNMSAGGTEKLAACTSSEQCLMNICTQIDQLYENVRAKLKVEYSERAVLSHINTYLKLLLHVQDGLCNERNDFDAGGYLTTLSSNIARTLYFFKHFHKQFTDGLEYSSQFREVLSIYARLQLRIASLFKESRTNVANRISLNYDLHFSPNKISILEIFINVRGYCDQKEVMRKLYEKYLKPETKHWNGLQRELDDKTFVSYLIAYKDWIALEDDIDEKIKIEEIANAFMRPMLTLRRNKLYAPFIPTYPTKNSTKSILSQKVNISSLIKAIATDDVTKSIHSCPETIDLCAGHCHYDADANLFLQNDFPVKFEASITVDLSTNSSKRTNTDLVWLESLARNVQSSKLVKQPASVIDIIEIDDDPIDGDDLQQTNDENSTIHGPDKEMQEAVIDKVMASTPNEFANHVELSSADLGNIPPLEICMDPKTDSKMSEKLNDLSAKVIDSACGKHDKINENTFENEVSDHSTHSQFACDDGNTEKSSLILITCHKVTPSTANKTIVESSETNSNYPNKRLIEHFEVKEACVQNELANENTTSIVDCYEKRMSSQNELEKLPFLNRDTNIRTYSNRQRKSDIRRLDSSSKNEIVQFEKDIIAHDIELSTKPRNEIQSSARHAFENDISTFSSYSAENDNSGDSNCLSILDESDNAEAEVLLQSANGHSDVPVEKVTPKMNVHKTNIDKIIFSVNANNQRKLNIESVESNMSNSKSTIVFSTPNPRKNVESNWIDPIIALQENSINVSQNEIISPPIEQFTKSDKTLFQTFLKNGKEPQSSGKSHIKSIEKQHTFLTDAECDKSNDLETSAVVPSAVIDEKNGSNLNNASSVQKRKCASFWNAKKEMPKLNDLNIVTEDKQVNGIIENVWSTDINTYVLNPKLATTSTTASPFQQSISSINIKSKQNAVINSDTGTNKQTFTFIKNQIEPQLIESDQTFNQTKVESLCPTIYSCDDTDKNDTLIFNNRCNVRSDFIDHNLIAQSFDNFRFSNGIHSETPSSITDDIDKNISPILPNDDLGEVLSDERFLLYYEEENSDVNHDARQIGNCEGSIPSLTEIIRNSYYSDELGIAGQHWLGESIGKREEGHISLPLKKRRKLSQFSDNISLKEEDLNYIESLKIGIPDESKELSNDCNSYPSTPMLSIANFEDRICVSHQPRRKFKTPAQLKEIGPVNLHGFNILPTQHTIVNSTGTSNCSDVTHTLQTFNILQPPQTLINNNHSNTSNVQTYSVIPASRKVVPPTNRTLIKDGHVYNVTPNIQSTADVSNINVGFDLSSRRDAPNMQAFNLSPNAIQFTHSFHPNQQYTYSIQTEEAPNNIGTISIPSIDIQGMINMSNYQMNSQHLSNFLHNSKINLQAKQAVLLNDIPCNLQLNHESSQIRRQNADHMQSAVSAFPNVCDINTNCTKQNIVNSSGVKKPFQYSPNMVATFSSGSHRNKQKKSKSRSTDRITRSSNRTSIVNYKDDTSTDSKGKKKRNASTNRK